MFMAYFLYSIQPKTHSRHIPFVSILDFFLVHWSTSHHHLHTLCPLDILRLKDQQKTSYYMIYHYQPCH